MVAKTHYEQKPDITSKIRHVLALSGGIDSAAILATHNPAITHCVFVDYGQPAAMKEHLAARALADRFDVPLYEYAVRGLDLGEMADESGKPGPRVVPGRNAIIASLCANVIGPEGGYIYFGAHRDDAAEYGDCRALFFDFLGSALLYAYKSHVCVPLINLTKAEVAAKLGAVLRDTNMCWSCYTPTDDGPCETCSSCIARQRVLHERRGG